MTSITLLGRTLQLPSPLLALLQLAFGISDVAVNAAIVWTLLGSAAPRYATFLGGYLVSVVAGLISGVPGGVGTEGGTDVAEPNTWNSAMFPYEPAGET